MIKSGSSFENKIILENNKTYNKQQICHKKNKTIRFKEKKEDEIEDKKTPTKRMKNRSIGKISSKINDYFLKKSKENEFSMSLKKKTRRKITQLKIYEPYITKNNICITDRSFYKNDSNQNILDVTSPSKNKTSLKYYLKNSESKGIQTPKYTKAFIKNFNKSYVKKQHWRNKSDLKISFSEINRNLYLTIQNNDKDVMKKYSSKLNNVIKEIDEPSYIKTEQNKVYDYNDKRFKTERVRSFNDSSKRINNIKLNNYKTNNNLIKTLKSNHTFILEPKKNNEHRYYNSSQKELFILRKRNKSQLNNIKIEQYNSLSKVKEKYNNFYGNKSLNRTFYGPKSNIKDSKINLNSTFCESNNNLLKHSRRNLLYKNLRKKHKSLEPILETEKYHYLEGTICTKNKMVKKAKNILDDYPTLRKVTTLLEKNELKGKERFKALDKNRKIINKNNETPSKKTETKIKMNNITIKKNNNTNNYNNINNKSRIKSKKCRISNRAASMDKSVSNLTALSNTPLFNGKIEDYLITKELGKGSYAVVKLAKHKVTKENYAIKIYTKESLLDPQKRNTVKNEINILKQLNHINIMKLYEVIDSSKYLYLVLEYIKGVSLLDIIKAEKLHYIEQHRALKLFLQIVKGISYCQSKNINHRDIKLENILVLQDDIIKIIDFGFAVKSNKETYQKLFCGTPSYMPPEIVNKEKYIAQYSDIWSLGVLLYAMLYGRFPFRGKDDDQLFELINEAEVIFPENISVDENIKALIKKLLNVEPKLRPSPEDIINEIVFDDI
jgi:hypothetical protein